MVWSKRLCVVVAIVALGGPSPRVSAADDGQERRAENFPVTQAASVAVGQIVGVVTDAAGVPLDGAMISAFGPSGSELALADVTGRFVLLSLIPGGYFIQAHLQGFAASGRELVEVSPAAPTIHTITLSRIGQVAKPLVAGVALSIRDDANEQIEESEEVPFDGDGAETSVPHDHGEKAWRLRRARRSVLKEVQTQIVKDAPMPVGGSNGGAVRMLARTFESPARLAMGLLALPLTGEVNLLTRGTLNSAADTLTGETRPAGIANLAVGAPVWRGDWSARAAMTTGDVTSWVVSGAYVADPDVSHRVGFGVSYGRQRYQGVNPAALTVPSESRYAASFAVSDSWTVSRRLTVDYGGRYATYGYAEEDGLFSPRVAFAVTPVTGLRIKVSGTQETVAPGAEEFLPPSDTGLWLPPERTFSALSPWGGLHPERTRHVDVGLEYDLPDLYVVGVRRFYQDVSDQMVTLFGVDELGNVPTGHYYLARAGSATSRGWMVTLSRQVGDQFNASLDYGIGQAHWGQHGADAALNTLVPGAVRPDVESFHDLSGVLETEIPATATRVFVRCRVNTAFVRADISEDPIGLDARFDIRLNQALPFTPFEGSQWEVLIAVRSLFFEPHDASSMFDELLVARPPRQFVGGLAVRF